MEFKNVLFMMSQKTDIMVDRILSRKSVIELVHVEVEAITKKKARYRIRRLLAVEYQGVECTLQMYTSPEEVSTGIWRATWMVNQLDNLRVRRTGSHKPMENHIQRSTEKTS